VAIAFTPAPATQSPNLRRTDDGRAAAAYYRAIVITFSSIRRWNPDADLKLVSDVDPPPPFDRQLADLDVHVLLTPFDHRPPEGFWPIFNASLYTIDALRALADDGSVKDAVLLLDPDILCTGNLGPVVDAIAPDTWVVYPLVGSYAEKTQGLEVAHTAELHQLLDDTLVGPPEYYGGELYGFRPETAGPVLDRAEAAWQLAFKNWKEQRPHFVTEEHLLNYALRRAKLADASPYIRRIWTAPVHRTVAGDELTLLLWHLPAEKDRGFPRSPQWPVTAHRGSGGRSGTSSSARPGGCWAFPGATSDAGRMTSAVAPCEPSSDG